MSVLVLTDTRDLAADLIVLELQRRGSRYRRLNVDMFPGGMEVAYDPGNSTATFYAGAERFSSDEVSVAWCRYAWPSAGTGPYAEREAQAFLQGICLEMSWTWVNHPFAVATASNKLGQLKAASRVGLDVPVTVVTNRIEHVRDTFQGPAVVVKTIAGAAIDHNGMRKHLYSQLLPLAQLDPEAVKAAPCIYQEQAKPGMDVRVTVAGDHVFATDIEAPASVVDWRAAPPEAVTYRSADIPAHVAKGCFDLCRIAGLAYGAFDFIRQPGGNYVFLEVNPSGQWGWIEQATGQRITEAIVDVLTGH
jgi:hypothetical protein